jgi:hypothetical protein
MTVVLNPSEADLEIEQAAIGRFFNSCSPEPGTINFSPLDLAVLRVESTAAKAELDAMTPDQLSAYDASVSALVHGNATDDDVQRVGRFQQLTEAAWRYYDALSVVRRVGQAALPEACRTVE